MENNEAVVLNNINDNTLLRIDSLQNDNGDIMSLVYEAYSYIQHGYADNLKDIIEILNRQYETIQQIRQYHEAMKEKIAEYDGK